MAQNPHFLRKNLHTSIQYTPSFWNRVQYLHMGHEICVNILTKIYNTHIWVTKYVLVYYGLIVLPKPNLKGCRYCTLVPCLQLINHES